MIAGALFLIFSSSFFGYEVFAFLIGPILDDFTIAGIGSSAGIIFSAWLFFLFSLFIPLNLAHGIIHSFILFIAGAVLQSIRSRQKIHCNKSKFPTSKVVCVVALLLPFLFLANCLRISLLYKNNITRGACYGDIPFHLSIISSFTYGCNKNRRSLFDLLTPFFANEKLAYTFIPDYYSAVLISCFNVSYHSSLFLPSLVYAYSIVVVLYQIILLFNDFDSSACIFGIWLFLFTGGMGFTQYYKYKHEYYIDFVNNWGNGRTEGWFQTIIHILLPQRCSLFALPITYSIILILMSAGKPTIHNQRYFVAAGLLVGALPQVQMHSVIAVAQWGVFYVLRSFPYRKFSIHFKQYLVNYSILGLVAIAIGLPQIYPFLSRVNSQANFMQLRLLWKDGSDRDYNFFNFWWYALGVFFLLSIFGRIVFHTFLNKKQRQYYDASLGIFILANFIWYQPWNLDNTKIFYAGWIPLAISLISRLLMILWRRLPTFGPQIAIVLFIIMSLSGFLANYLAMTRAYPVWHESPLDLASWVNGATDPKSVWITDSSHTNPIVAIAGRQTLAGYAGWIVSHGLSDDKRKMIMRRLMQNPDDTRAIDRLNVSYVMSRAETRNEFNFEPSSDSRYWKLIYQSKQAKIYQRTRFNNPI